MGIPWGVWFEPTQPVARLVDLARLAEALGAEACFVADEGTERDVHVALTAILLGTERVVVAPAITNPFSRHPVTTAAAIATLHELAPGRVWHGLGVGGSRVLEPLGIRSDKPYTALRETVELNRALLGGQSVDGAALPWFTGDVPMAVAGRGSRVQHLAASQADWVIFSGKARRDLAAEASRVRAAGQASIIWSAYVAPDLRQRARVLRHFTYMAVDAPADIRAAAGLDDERTELVRSAMLAGDMDAAASHLPDALVDVYGVAGTPSECATVIASHRAHFDLFMLPLNDESTSKSHIRAGARILDQAGSLSGIAE